MYAVGMSVSIVFREETLCAIQCRCGVTHITAGASIVFVSIVHHRCDYKQVSNLLFYTQSTSTQKNKNRNKTHTKAKQKQNHLLFPDMLKEFQDLSSVPFCHNRHEALRACSVNVEVF